MNKYKKLMSNSLIFAIGNLGSQLINIILVPLYTYHLSTAEYGTADIIMTTLKMLLPIISLSIYDAALRFVMDKKEDRSEIFTNSVLITMLGTFVASAICFAILILKSSSGFLGYLIAILILQAFQNLLAQFTRAIGKIKIFAANGLLMTLVTGLANIILLVYLDKGIDGYLLSIIISNITSIAFLTGTVRAYKYYKKNKVNIELIKEMLIYCLPLIPNALMWWVINASNRYFILFFVGASANGLYAVANKIPSLLSILNSIFFQSWQLSAIEEYGSNEKSIFYSNVFYYFQMFMFTGAACIVSIIKFVMNLVVANEFYKSWEYVPFLLMGIVFSSFSSFLGTNYIAAKDTKGAFKSSVIGGLINIVASITLIPLIGAIGAGIATTISFFSMWILRVYDTRKFIKIKINTTNLISNIFVILLQILILFLGLDTKAELIVEIFLLGILLFVNIDIFKSMVSVINRYVSVR